MKNPILILAAVAAVSLTGCLEKSKPANPTGSLYRSHFIGTTQLAESTNAATLKEVWNLPAPQTTRKQALEKIAKTPFQLWQKTLPSGAIDHPELIRPLLEDLVASESFIDLKGSAANYDSIIAVQLDKDRARLWETNLWQLLSGWKFSKPQPLTGAVAGWEARGNGITFQLQTRGKWLLAGWSLGKISAINSLKNTLEKSDRPVPPLTNSILDLHADLPSLGRWSPLLAKYQVPPVDVVVLPRGDYLRTEARLTLPSPLSWKFQPWQIPTNLVKQPLVSFNVAQGIQPLLNALPGFTDLGLQNTPSQVCGWSHGELLFKTYWAFPTDHASNVLRQIAPKAPSFLKNYLEEPPGNLVYVTNKSEINWRGIPFMDPRLKAVTDSGRDYLVVALLPPPSEVKPAPQELFAQLKDRNDLLYYGWEITQQRLWESRWLYMANDMFKKRTMPGTNDILLDWSHQAGPRLGNTATEVSMNSPTELKVVRKSHIGFTGFEVATLVRWIDSPGFPLSYEPPPPLFHGKQDRPKQAKK